MSKPYSEWSYKEKEEMSWLRIPVMTIIEVNSGGHPSITNIQGLNYLGSRRDLLKRLFNTEEYTEVMKLLADEFISNLKTKIDDVKMGKDVEYQKTDVELHGDVTNESFEYYLKTNNGDVKPVTKDEFLKAGFDSKFEPKKIDNKGFSMDIKDKKIIGRFD
jgi:predicted transcriptional regulator